MSHADLRNAEPGAGTPGFARSAFSRLVASLAYRIGLAGANFGSTLLPFALDGAGYCAALLWGAAR